MIGTIGSAAVRFVGKDDTGSALRSIVRNTETAQKQITSKLRGAFQFLGAGTAFYALSRAIASTVRMGDDLAKFASKSGLAAEAASELAHAAKMADIDLGSLETGIKKMQVTLSQAASGNKAATTTLQALGLTFKDLDALSPDAQFELIAEQISKVKDPADRTRIAVELFGRAGANLLPMFEQGAAGIRAAREEAQQLGQSFTEEELKRFQAADTAFKELAASARGLGADLTLKLLPPLIAVTNAARDLLRGDIDWGVLGRILSGGSPAGMIKNAAFELARGANSAEDAALAANNRRIGATAFPFIGNGLPGGGKDAPGYGDPAPTEAAINELRRFHDLIIRGADTIVADYTGKFERVIATYETRLDESLQLSSTIAPPLSENEAALGGLLHDFREETDLALEFGEILDANKKKAENLMSTLKDEGARQAFSAFSDIIYNMGEGADDFADSMLSAFRRILANSITQQLFELLGGLGNGGTSGGFLGFVGSLFSGFTSAPMRDSGGRGQRGQPYRIGKGAQPELFIPDSAGTFIPRNQQGGGGGAPNVTVAPVYNIDARGADAGVLPRIQQMIDGSVKAMEAHIIEGFRNSRYRLTPT